MTSINNGRTRADNPKASPTLPVIGYLEKQDRTIIIKSSSLGPVFSVVRKDGRHLLEDLSLEQLKAQAPELHEFIKAAVAGGSAKEQVAGKNSVKTISSAFR